MLTMPAAVRRSRSGRARAEAPASAAETSGALRSRHAIEKKKAIAETTAARAPLRTTIAIATLTDSARASPEKDAKPPSARGESASNARSRTARKTVARNDRPFRARRAPRRETREAPRILNANKCRVYVLTYFFSSLTIDKRRALGVPFGWIGSAAAEWLGVPICHSNVQLQSPRDPSDVCEFGFEGGARKGTGVYQCSAGANPHLAFTRQTRCYLGETSLCHEQVVSVLDDLRREWSSDSYHLLTRNCNDFADALVRKLLPVKKLPAYVNRGARLLRALPAPFPGALPRCVSAFLPAGGSWTAGAVCAMAERERRLAGVRDFRERRDWDGAYTAKEKEGARRRLDDVSRRVDPLAAHLKPVPLVGEHARSWAF